MTMMEYSIRMMANGSRFNSVGTQHSHLVITHTNPSFNPWSNDPLAFSDADMSISIHIPLLNPPFATFPSWPDAPDF
jgi:hypothetical protein